MTEGPAADRVATLYRERGLLYLEGFYSHDELSRVRAELEDAEARANRDLEKNWNSERVTFFTNNPVKAVSAKNAENFVVTPYFQESAGKTHVFFEEIDDRLVLNRMGHGLHRDPANASIHGSIYDDPRMRSLLRAAGYADPFCLLSIYIPKHPNGHGSEVKPHQESTFATTRPLSAAVLWVALEDATLENACMWGLPESHRLPLKFVSRVDHDRKSREYVQIADAEIPEFREEAPYVPLEVKAGDALFFHGNYVHCSPRNTSARSRKALSFQFLEGTATSEFLAHNWIRRPDRRSIYGEGA